VSITLSVQSDTDREQRLLMPVTYNWQEFEALKALLVDSPGLRITYLDGSIELMTLGESHEQIKSLIGMFLEAYFIAMEIEFTPVGIATRRGEEKGTSFEPDESYYLNVKKEQPDLAIEVILTSGNLRKLEKYRRFQIPEV
jgi:Uma2 family endonuclease